jgi:hypothetical protein
VAAVVRSSVVPDIEAVCDDNEDDDCDQLMDCQDPDCSQQLFCKDSDQDGFTEDKDCDDYNPNINPEAEELCNTLDDDCDGSIDEDLSRQCGSSDTGACQLGTERCISGVWAGCTAILPKTELCNNIDDDCDGEVDEGCDCITGQTRECGIDTGACQKGAQSCTDGQWSVCIGAIQPAAERCNNNVDDDCDGQIDEDCAPATAAAEPEQPADVPQETAAPTTAPEVTQAPAEIPTRPCIDNDDDGFGQDCVNGFDCDDTNPTTHPGAEELCNNIDDDCDSLIDNGLQRECGLSDIGICTMGAEQCRNGAWSGCTAVFPEDERCDNRLDDDCDGSIDEECVQRLSDNELALKQFLDIKYGEENYDLGQYLEDYRETRDYVNIIKSSEVKENRTTIRIRVVPVQGMRNITIFEYVPKFIAHSADLIKFEVQPEIIQADPLFAWHFDELDEPVDLSYEVSGGIEDAHENTATITVAEKTEPLQRAWYFSFLPLLFIPVLGLVFVFLVEIAHRRS